MDKKHNKLIQLAKKNWTNMLILAIGVALLAIPEAKVIANQGLMKAGIFNPKIKTIEANSNTSNLEKLSFSMVDDKGEKLELKDLKGKVIFLNFWATWCAPCIAEMPSINELAQTFKEDENVVFVMLEVEGNHKKALNILQKRKFDLPVYFPRSNIPQELFYRTLPTTVVFDKKGNLVFKEMGMANYASQGMKDFIKELAK